MKIWLDDQLQDPNCPARHVPEGFVGCENIREVAHLIKKGDVQFISFDHDLGDKKFSGYVLARLIEKWAFQGRIGWVDFEIHSANPVGRGNIQRAMLNAQKYTREK